MFRNGGEGKRRRLLRPCIGSVKSVRLTYLVDLGIPAWMLSRELIAASAEPLVLSILQRGENYGYAIAERVRLHSQGKMEWTEGMLYPVLHRLERRKLLKSRWELAEGGRRRRYYSLTARGRDALAERRAEWMAFHATLTEAWGA
jgi:PadR family transcriptional regulator PadR